MKVILNERALYLMFPADAANIDASICELDKMLKDMVKNDAVTGVWKQVFDGFVQLSKRRNENAKKV
jgi:hypothetical protein